MTDTISKDDFKKGMTKLEDAFMKEPPRNTIITYYEKLNYVTNSAFEHAIDFIIDTDHFFPSIARLKEVLPAPKPNQESIEELCS